MSGLFQVVCRDILKEAPSKNCPKPDAILETSPPLVLYEGDVFDSDFQIFIEGASVGTANDITESVAMLMAGYMCSTHLTQQSIPKASDTCKRSFWELKMKLGLMESPSVFVQK